MPNKVKVVENDQFREKLIELLSFFADGYSVENRHIGEGTKVCEIADHLIANGVRLEESKRIEELEAKLAEREEAVCNLRKKWDAAEVHICTMCGHFDHKTDGNIVYGNKNCGELVGYPCCGKFTPWIPVTERLPEAHEIVMTWSEETRDMELASRLEYFEEDAVTHWMSLPTPPKGE